MTTLTRTADAPSLSIPAPSTVARWAARILTGLAVAFLAFDSVGKVLQLAPVMESAPTLGIPAGLIPVIGWIGLACLALYLIPRTAPLGAILWTGYLGGAIATHARLEQPLFTHTLFPIYVAALLWLPLWLRDARVRALTSAARR
ncbi:MAG TPA: DoxX family protein [Kofleriaceae bacterium]|nr:DoxX family protein [Kofleriaceae bacterium]